MSIDDVAALISQSNCWMRFNRIVIELLETDRCLPTLGFIDRLRTAFAFDRYVYRQLLCNSQPAPEICTACGCSALDACQHEIAGTCAWATPAHDLCTTCALSGARPRGE